MHEDGPRTLFEKVWEQHVVADDEEGRDLVLVDRIMLHERGGGIALESLTRADRSVRRPSSVFATLDHVVDTRPERSRPTAFPGGDAFIDLLETETRRHEVRFWGLDSEHRGITHVIAAEQAVALPGVLLVCNDSHTATVGGVGALGFGVGSTQLEHALAIGALWLRRPVAVRVSIDGEPAPGTEAKDLVLALIGLLGANGANGCAVEFAGRAVESMGVEARMTICNMAVEFAARTALVAPDDTTLDYLQGRRYAPTGSEWSEATKYWRTLASDPGSTFDREVAFDASAVAPQVTWGLSPAHVIGIDDVVPALDSPEAEHAYRRMALRPGMSLQELPVDVAFVGSCTNGRLSDLRAVAAVVKGRRVAHGVKAICVPGSTAIRIAAEKEGLADILRDAGFEWRDAGCSLCFFGGGEGFGGARVVSSTNRNFENRQGPGAMTHLASPATVAASAVAGQICDPRSSI